LIESWLWNACWEYPLQLAVLAPIVAVQGGGSFALRKMPLLDYLVPAALRA